MYRRVRGYAPASLALVSHSHDILLHDWGIQTIHKCQLRPMLTATAGAPAQGSEAEQGQRLWVNLNLCLCHKVFISSRVALSASLTLVAHIHTPPLHEKGGSGTLHTSPGQPTGGHRGAKGWSTNNVCIGDLRVSHCVPFIWADQGLLWGSSGLQNRGERERFTDLRI